MFLFHNVCRFDKGGAREMLRINFDSNHTVLKFPLVLFIRKNFYSTVDNFAAFFLITSLISFGQFSHGCRHKLDLRRSPMFHYQCQEVTRKATIDRSRRGQGCRGNPPETLVPLPSKVPFYPIPETFQLLLIFLKWSRERRVLPQRGNIYTRQD